MLQTQMAYAILVTVAVSGTLCSWLQASLAASRDPPKELRNAWSSPDVTFKMLDKSNVSAKHMVQFIEQALFLCNICVVFRLVVPFGDLLFIHALTNATDNHKYSPLPSADFDSSGVLVSFSTFIFS